jgi:hypothetical protein
MGHGSYVHASVYARLRVRSCVCALAWVRARFFKHMFFLPESATDTGHGSYVHGSRVICARVMGHMYALACAHARVHTHVCARDF